MKTNICILLFLSLLASVAVAQEREMKIASFNIRYSNDSDYKAGNGWQNRCPVVASMIQFYDWDIIGAQECLINQLNDLKPLLPAYDFIGVGREDGNTAGEYAAIFYKTAKYTVLNQGHFWLSKTPDVPSVGWDAVLKRICTWVQLEEKSTGFRFFAFNLHYDHKGEKSRRLASELTLQKIREIAGNNPVMLTGDFNQDQDSEGYKTFLSSGFLYDSYLYAPVIYVPNGTFNAFHFDTISRQRIDHVFISAAFRVQRYGILTDIYWHDQAPHFPSDHFPVMVVLNY